MTCGDWAFPVVPWWYPLIGRPVGGPPRDIRIVSELAEYGAAVSINRLPKAGDCVAVVFWCGTLIESRRFRPTRLHIAELLLTIDSHYENGRNGEVYREYSSKNVLEIAIC